MIVVRIGDLNFPGTLTRSAMNLLKHMSEIIDQLRALFAADGVYLVQRGGPPCFSLGPVRWVVWSHLPERVLVDLVCWIRLRQWNAADV